MSKTAKILNTIKRINAANFKFSLILFGIIIEMEKFAKRTQLNKTVKENLTAAQTYFANNRHRMNYADHVANDLPIGSGGRRRFAKRW